MERQKKMFSATAVFIVLLIGQFGSARAQSAAANERTAKIAAQRFYQMYLPIFGAPFGHDLKKLRPYLSPGLYSLFEYELRRMKEWSAKNPNDKPPLVEDVFICNHDEPPQKFQVGKIMIKNQRAVVTINFEYSEKGKIRAHCQTQTEFIYRQGKWLFDNVRFQEGADLQKLLSRKNYTELPN